jgi:hypothetical protein
MIRTQRRACNNKIYPTRDCGKRFLAQMDISDAGTIKRGHSRHCIVALSPHLLRDGPHELDGCIGAATFREGKRLRR